MGVAGVALWQATNGRGKRTLQRLICGIAALVAGAVLTVPAAAQTPDPAPDPAAAPRPDPAPTVAGTSPQHSARPVTPAPTRGAVKPEPAPAAAATPPAATTGTATAATVTRSARRRATITTRTAPHATVARPHVMPAHRVAALPAADRRSRAALAVAGSALLALALGAALVLRRAVQESPT